MTDITELLREMANGNAEAASVVMERVYQELHRLAAAQMRRERRDHTLQTTALVNEAYLRVVGNREANWQNRAQFFGVAAQMMRRILINHARAHGSAKRGGLQERITLDAADVPLNQPGEVLALDEALTRLAETDPRQARIVELRFFAGLSIEETAQVLDVSLRTVKRDWRVARAWLYSELANGDLHHTAKQG